MQEASMQNVLSLKLSVWDLEQSNLSWVLLKKDIHINTIPTLGDDLTIVTYPSGFKKIFAYRDFKVYNTKDELMATASSTWGLMDMEKRRLVMIPAYEFYNVIPEGALDPPSFSLKNDVIYNQEFQTRMVWHDLDWNGHINNSVLIKKMLESLSPEIFDEYKLDSIKIQFKSESFLKDVLTSKSNFTNNESFHCLYRESDNKAICLSQIQWKRRKN
jgi:acyl-ACP thioesterase